MNSLKARLEAFQRTRAGLFIKKVLDDQAPNLAALLAWGTLSAILPLLLGVLSVAGLVLRDQQRLDQIYNSIVSVLPAEAAGPVTGVLDGVRQGAGPAGVIAILLLLINGSSFFSNMASVFNQAYHVQGRNMFIERAIALGMLLLTTALLVLSTFAAGVSSVVSNLPGALPIGPVAAQVAGWSIGIISVFVLFLLIYRILPNASHSWRAAVPGTLLASVLLLLVTQLFPIYMNLFPPNHAYALFGVFLVFTFWLYLVGWVFVLGAELNAFLEEPTRATALAEATAAAAHGRANYEANTGRVTAEAEGQAPAMRGGGPLGTPQRSAQSQIQGEQRAEQPAESTQKPTLAGRVLGLVGLVVAALLLRQQSASRASE